jgi:hypothetical protein
LKSKTASRAFLMRLGIFISSHVPSWQSVVFKCPGVFFLVRANRTLLRGVTPQPSRQAPRGCAALQ